LTDHAAVQRLHQQRAVRCRVNDDLDQPRTERDDRLVTLEEMAKHLDPAATPDADRLDQNCIVRMAHAATAFPRRAERASSASNSDNAVYNLPIEWSVAPIGSGFRLVRFQRLNVVGLRPALAHSFPIGTPTRRARCSMSAMIDAWSIPQGIICNLADCNSNLADTASLHFC
jgi:hypothetical protein